MKKNDSTHTKIVVSPQTKQFIGGFSVGLIVGFVFNMPLKFWLATVAIIFIIFGIACVINPMLQCFTYILLGFFIGIAIAFIIGFFFFDYSLMKLNF